MFLRLPLGVESSRVTQNTEIDIGALLQRLSREEPDWINDSDSEAIDARIKEILKYIEVSHVAGGELAADLPNELPKPIKRFLAFSALMAVLNCWIEVISATRENLDNGRSVFTVTVAKRDKNGLFPLVMNQYIAIGLPYLAGDADRELGGFFSAYVMAASSLVESAFHLPELTSTRLSED